MRAASPTRPRSRPGSIEGDSRAQVVRFDVVAVVAALLMAAAMKLATTNLGLPVVAAKLACAAIVFAIWTYPAQRRLVFARGAEVARVVA